MSADGPTDAAPPELSRPIKTRLLTSDPVVIEANEAERSALAARFSIAAIGHLKAEIKLKNTANGIAATGPLNGSIAQVCAVSGEEFGVAIEEDINLLFVEEAVLAARHAGAVNEDGAIEVDLTASDTDEIGYTGGAFDLGEAVAQSLGLAIDPYAEGPGADAARAEAGLADENTPSGPLAAALGAALGKS